MILRRLTHFCPLFPSALPRTVNCALMHNYTNFNKEYRVLAATQKSFTKYLGVFMLIGPHPFHPKNLQEPFKDIPELLEPVLKNSWRTGKFPEKYDRLNLVFHLYSLAEFYTRLSFKKGTRTNY